MGQQYRHELKFICSRTELSLLESRIRLFCPLDPHVGKESGYHIRSVYFDTPENDAFYENENGDNDRAKYRIRIYNYSDAVIKLERKSSRNGLKHKESCNLTRLQCGALLSGIPGNSLSLGDQLSGGASFDSPYFGTASLGDLPSEEASPFAPLLRSFLAERELRQLRPRILVDYHRTPYIYPIGNVRITFDRNIRASCTAELFRRDIPSYPVLPDQADLLEVKYDEILPQALLEALTYGHDLRRTSFSKYYLSRSRYRL